MLLLHILETAKETDNIRERIEAKIVCSAMNRLIGIYNKTLERSAESPKRQRSNERIYEWWSPIYNWSVHYCWNAFPVRRLPMVLKLPPASMMSNRLIPMASRSVMPEK